MDEGISIRHLYEMLEGQVAVLSSGYLSAADSVELLDAFAQVRYIEKINRVIYYIRIDNCSDLWKRIIFQRKNSRNLPC